MKLIFNQRWLQSDGNLAILAKRKISKLAGLERIEAAEVTLERLEGTNPPFAARAHLVIPGPDLYAEEKDHTPEGTIRKVLAKLSRQLRHRKGRLLAKRRDGRPGRDERGPWNGSSQTLPIQLA